MSTTSSHFYQLLYWFASNNPVLENASSFEIPMGSFIQLHDGVNESVTISLLKDWRVKLDFVVKGLICWKNKAHVNFYFFQSFSLWTNNEKRRTLPVLYATVLHSGRFLTDQSRTSYKFLLKLSHGGTGSRVHVGEKSDAPPRFRIVKQPSEIEKKNQRKCYKNIFIVPRIYKILT